MPNMPLAPKAGPFTKFMLKIAGADEQKLRLCPPEDWANVRAVAEIMMATWLYQAALFTVIAHRLAAAPDEIRLDLVLASMFIASFILLIDSYMVMRSGWHLSGIEEIKRGGLDISGGLGPRIKANCFLAIRIILSIGLAQLTAIFMSLLIFGADIDARLRNNDLRANAHLVTDATALVDAEIKRATEAVAAESARADALGAQVAAMRQNEVDPAANDPQMQAAQQEVTQLLAQKAKVDDEVGKAESFASDELAGVKGAAGNSGVVGNGPRRRAAIEQVANAKSRAAEAAAALDAGRNRLEALRKQRASANDALTQRSHDQLPAFESSLAAENAKLAAMKDQLTKLIEGRGAAIRKAVESAPDYVRPDNGFLAQVRALEAIAQEDSKISGLIILIDVVSFGFELAAVLAKVTSYVPTTYASLLARDAYLRSVRMVDQIMVEVDAGPRSRHGASEILPPGMPANDNAQGSGQAFGPAPSGAPDDPSNPPKRPRGRPRKTIH